MSQLEPTPDISRGVARSSVDLLWCNRLLPLGGLRNEYLICRHGRSEANQLRIVSCDPSVCRSAHGLIAEGEQQARDAFGAAVHSGVIDSATIFVSSDFLRALQTAEIGRSIAGASAVVSSPLLRERNFGAYHGQPGNGIHELAWRQDVKDPMCKADPFGGSVAIESAAEVMQRVTQLVYELEQRFSGKTIVIVGHGDPLRILNTAFHKLDPAMHPQLPAAQHCEIVRLRLAGSELPGHPEHAESLLMQLRQLPIVEERMERALVGALAGDGLAEASTLISILKMHPRLRLLYESDHAPPYTTGLEEHTLRVIAQFGRYFADVTLPTGFVPRHFQLFLALHDIGKPLRSSALSQHESSKEVLTSMASSLPFSPDEWPVVLAMISGDPLGRYFTSVVSKPPSAERRNLAAALAEGRLKATDFWNYVDSVHLLGDSCQMEDRARLAACEIRSAAARAQVDGRSYFELLTIYHQVDLAGYTFDAGGYPALDFALAQSVDRTDGLLTRKDLPSRLLRRHESGRRLLYSPQAYEPAYQRLEACLERQTRDMRSYGA